MMGQFTHIFLTLVFAGLPLVFIVLKYSKIIEKNIKTIFITFLILQLYSLLADNAAVSVNIWNYTDGVYSGIRTPFMAFDDLIFIAFVQILISSVTIIAIERFRLGS